jgi:hypothetical protein
MAKQRRPEDARRRMGKTLQVKRETSLDVDGRRVGFCEYEDVPEGDFVKICSDDLDAWYAAEDAWFAAKYPGAVRIREERLIRMKLNGNEVACDILTLKLPGGGTRKVYFDVSQVLAACFSICPPDPFREKYTLDSEDYTAAEQAEILKKYEAEGGFERIKGHNFPRIIRKALFRDWTGGDPFTDAGEDVLVLLKRLNLDEKRREFKKVFEKLRAVKPVLFKDVEENKTSWELECSLHNRTKTNVKAELLKAAGVSADQPPAAEGDPFTFSPLEKARILESWRMSLDAFVKSLAPFLGEEKNAALASRFKDFCDLANERFNEIENAAGQSPAAAHNAGSKEEEWT